jgi:DNA (cytosine-5)-methyltransferase 1
MRPGETAGQFEERKPGIVPYDITSFPDKYRKLKPDSPSPTIPSHLSRDSNSFIHPLEDRGLTVREAARLQSFPDVYVFVGTRSRQFSQVGNAFPPLVAREVADSILRNLDLP